jgi:hypothetical protein
MRVVWNVSGFAHEQPDEATWTALAGAADELDPAGAALAPPFMRILTLDSAGERDRVLARLGEVRGAVLHVAPSTRLDEADLVSADYVAVWADEERLMVLEPDSALLPTGPCPRCGAADAFDLRQVADLSLADDAVEGDTSDLPGGGLAVSARVYEALASLPGSRLGTRPLRVGPEGRESQRWFQVLAERAALTPCPEHTVIEGDPFCPACGTAYGTVLGAFTVPSQDLAGVDVVARHPSLRTMLHLSRRADDALRAAGVADLTRADLIELCAHPG